MLTSQTNTGMHPVIFALVLGVPILIYLGSEYYKKRREQEQREREEKKERPVREKRAAAVIKAFDSFQEKFINGVYDEEIIEFIKPYQRVPLETIVSEIKRKHTRDWESFREGVSYNHEINISNRGWVTTSRLVFTLIKERLETLIKNRKIAGYIRPFGDVLCYIVLEPALPPIHIGDVAIGDIGDKINVQTGDISIGGGERNYCPNCGFKTEKDWNTCPNCTTSLIRPTEENNYCAYCGKKVQSEWKVCAYCSSNIS